MSKRKTIGAKKNIIFRIALLVFAVYMVFTMISLQAELAENKKILSQAKDKMTALQISNDELTYLLKSGSKEELIERAAREKLDYVYKNEEVYEDISGK